MESPEAEIYKEFYSKILSKLKWSFARRFRAGNSETADDLVQQAFEIFFKKLKESSIELNVSTGIPEVNTEDGKTYPLEGYLFGIARNLLRDYLKKNRWVEFESIDEENPHHNSEITPHLEIETKILLKEFWSMLNTEEKYILEQKLFGHNYRKISEKFKVRFNKHMTEENLRKIFQRKIRQLAKKYL